MTGDRAGWIRKAVAAASVAATLSCTSVGPSVVPQARFDYNEALSRSWNEQLLLNLVRLRYRDTPLFLEVGSVVSQYTATTDVGATVAGATTSSDLAFGGSAGWSWSEKPTVSYTPLQGSEFVERLLKPISPGTILLLSGAGWSIERLLLCCVGGINDLDNASSAAGPTPSTVPPFEEYHRAARLLRELQVEGAVLTRVREESGVPRVRLTFTGPVDPEKDRHVAELVDLLGVDPDPSGHRVVLELSEEVLPTDLRMRGRSFLGVLFFLSQAVEAPREHVDAGWVTRTLDTDGREFDWNEMTENLLRVRSGPERPDEAFVRVRYRGHWFWIDDADLQSKTTFSLLTFLFSLQSTAGSAGSPLLTLSAGG